MVAELVRSGALAPPGGRAGGGARGGRAADKEAAIDALNANPFDAEAQVRVEGGWRGREEGAPQKHPHHPPPHSMQAKIEAILRQEAVDENMETAMEHAPESFGSVVMLYVSMAVNRRPVQAFVDSGAQTTIMSAKLAGECGILRLLDERFKGMAVGVGSAPILGRVHAVPVECVREGVAWMRPGCLAARAGADAPPPVRPGSAASSSPFP